MNEWGAQDRPKSSGGARRAQHRCSFAHKREGSHLRRLLSLSPSTSHLLSCYITLASNLLHARRTPPSSSTIPSCVFLLLAKKKKMLGRTFHSFTQHIIRHVIRILHARTHLFLGSYETYKLFFSLSVQPATFRHGGNADDRKRALLSISLFAFKVKTQKINNNKEKKKRVPERIFGNRKRKMNRGRRCGSST